MKSISVVKDLCERCIAEGEIVLKTEWAKSRMGSMVVINPTVYVDLENFIKWKANCSVLMNLLNKYSKPWSSLIKEDTANTKVNALSMLGVLKSLKETIDNDLLVTIEDIIFAESFSNLIEQSEYLFSQNYFLAAGILCRAVLEEKLRNLSNQNNCLFTKSRPTLNDYNTELYKISFYDKIIFKNIEYLISIGNNAAHNQPISKDDIDKLLNGVKDLLLKFS